uniref:Uncharacterized protein n=1 Tax=Rousettus bat poxvirus TaxID=3141933 RepID=A0AAU7E2E7_9POXV
MEIFNTIQRQEKALSPNMRFMMPEKKLFFTHCEVTFAFYRPKERTVARYLRAANIRHTDLAVFGKVYIAGTKMLFIFMDLGYCGITNDGTVTRLGHRIARLAPRGRCVYTSYRSSSAEQ